MKELRCKKCNKLLAIHTENSALQVKCSRCKTLNEYVLIKEPIGGIKVKFNSITK